MARHSFADTNRAKADFNSIYVQPDPRAYFNVLGGLDYVIPHLAQPVFQQLIAALRRKRRKPLTVLDLGCSYGVNGALMKYGITLDVLRERYGAAALQRVSAAELARLDRNFFGGWPADAHLRVIGLDVSKPAIDYAQACGAIDIGIAADLENGELPAWAAAEIGKVDLIVSTGCVGYVSDRTFARLLNGRSGTEAPWVASFVLRMFGYDAIDRTLAAHGLVTEKFEGATFVQRRFRDTTELDGTLDALEARSIDGAGRESEGLFHAELFVSRPQQDVVRATLPRIVSIASGINRRFGPRPRSGAPRTQAPQPALC